jgi:hypothetical protein
MDIDLNKGRSNRGMENPLSAIFDLADDVSQYSRYVKKMVWYAIIFMMFWMFFNFLLVLLSLSTGQGILFLVLMGLMISGLVAILLILRTHLFFQYFTRRYNGIRTVRDSGEPAVIPKGATIEDRYLRFLKDKHPPLEQTLKHSPKALTRSAKLTGATGASHLFDLYMTLPPDFSWKVMGFGEAPYGLFIKKFKGKPKMTDILDFKNAVKDAAEAQEIVPSRIVLLYKCPKNFKGLSDDLYSFLTREEFKYTLKGKNYFPVIQVVGETEEGFYDFTPLVPEFADRMP